MAPGTLPRLAARSLRRTIPNLWIVGFPKSGTSALWQILHRHSALQPAYRPDGSPLKECYLLYPKKHWEKPSLPQPPRSPATCRRSAARLYLRHPWPGYGLLPRYRIESSPDYVYEPDAAGLIETLDPQARIVICLRDPAEQLLSLYKHWQRIGLHSGPIRFVEDDETRGGIPHTRRLAWATGVQRFTDRFPAERIRFVLFEDFLEDNARVAGDLIAWLGLAREPLPLPPKEATDTPDHVDPEFRLRARAHFEPQLDALARLSGLDLARAWGS